MSEESWVSQYNFVEESRKDFSFPKKVSLYDVTLRDGEQVPGLVFRRKEKVEIARKLDELGVQRIEAGMPVVSPEDKAAVKEIASLGLNAETWGFCRCVKTDIDACIECDVDGVICEISTSDLKMKAYGFSREKVLQSAMTAVTYSKEHGLRTVFFAVDATRANLEFLKKIYCDVVNQAHADEAVVVDTLGVTTPEAMYYLTKEIKKTISVPLHAHCHNDFGLVTACSLAAVKAGAEWVHVTVNGIGEKAGNGDLAEIALSLNLLYGVDVGIKYPKLREVSKLVEKYSEVSVSPIKPIVGDYVFKRESGLAVMQLVQYPPAVESFLPELVGAKREIVLGKKSGKHSLEWKLKELGVKATDTQIEKILEKVKLTSENKKGLVSDNELQTIVNSVLNSEG